GPMHAGFDFMGWDHTAEEIQAKLAAGEDVTVLPVWERQLVYVSITVNGGYISSASGMSGDKYLANSKTTVTANTPAQNQKFAYWTDSTGKVLSYDSVYSFYPAADTTLTAVFVAQDADIEYQALVNVNTFTVADPYGNVSISWYVPEDAMNVEFIGAGLVSVQDKNYTEEAFVHGTTDTNVYDRTVDTENAIGSYVWTGPYTAGTKHFVKAWVQYKTADDQVVTLYSDMFTVDRTEE
ncbi:MAG: hypothetical protein IJV88_00795, partial [Ruminococcus sp.]|nr:hypothetical protein [Ruminococcus sp.]